MKKFLFRAEAVNLTPTVYDTSDISTIRGGGFYLLNRVGMLAQHTNWKQHLITEGASSAVFAIETNDPNDIRQQLLKFLYNGSQPIKEMMFIVEYIEETNSFPEDMARLMGKVRYAQMQSPSIRIFPETLKAESGMDFDELNRVLPAHQWDSGKEKNLSSFTYSRREQGKPLRQEIYKNVLGSNIDGYEFTNDLESLSKDSSQGNLDGKIAYIYIDGNKFGALQRSFSKAELGQYDNTLHTLKKLFLQAIINLVKDRPSFINKQKEVRLETLLWGGDEIKLIVPAWLGWEVASLFYQVVAKQNPLAPEHTPGGVINRELTYAMGLVFSHHKNPIRNIDTVAGMLVDAVKSGLKNDPGNKPEYYKCTGNRMHYMVLESLETMPSSYDLFAKEYYRTVCGDLVLTSSEMDELKTFAANLKSGISRSWLHEIARSWALGSQVKYTNNLQRALDISPLSKKDKLGLSQEIQTITGTTIQDGIVQSSPPGKGYRWLQVAELWDYLL
uniref:Uncharacterized protein n=1 Tax=uncultured Desulfobacterium sp. TaxID=201089 RepID=E1YF66_9BACT|nr:hypothetical protein N47_J01910 [uncultured Desulfobacterium sp.]